MPPALATIPRAEVDEHVRLWVATVQKSCCGSSVDSRVVVDDGEAELFFGNEGDLVTFGRSYPSLSLRFQCTPHPFQLISRPVLASGISSARRQLYGLMHSAKRIIAHHITVTLRGDEVLPSAVKLTISLMQQVACGVQFIT